MQKISLPTRWFPPNPISQAELAYLERQPQGRRWWRLLEWGMFILGIILLVSQSLRNVIQSNARFVDNALGLLPGVFIAYVVLRHFSLMFQTLSLSANSIAREKQAMTWDMLVITGVDARQFVYGKWLAIVQRQLSAYVLLALLRAQALLIWSEYLSRDNYRATYRADDLNLTRIIPPLPQNVLLAVGIIMFLTLINLFFTAAFGVLASSQSKRPVMALLRAVITRLLVPVLFVLAVRQLLLTIYIPLHFELLPKAVHFMVNNTALTLIDNGATLIWPLVATQYLMKSDLIMNSLPYSVGSDPVLLTLGSGLLALVYYTALIFILFRWTQRRLIRSGILSPSHKS